MRLRYLNLWEDLVPLDLRQALWRRTLALTGGLLMLGAFTLAIALASWSSDDPSIDHATSAAPQNWLGGPGATLSDLLMQFFGFGSLAIVLLTAGWGWRLAAGRPITRPLVRLMIMIVAMAIASGLLSALPSPEGWPLAAGLGGVFGDATYRLLSWPLDIVAAIFGPEVEAGFAALLIVGATAVVGHISGLTLRRPQAARRGEDDDYDDDYDDDDEPTDDAISLWPAIRLIGTWSWRVLSAVIHVLHWLWRRVLTGRSEEGQSRLKIAMARVNDDDLRWSESADYYVSSGGRRKPRHDPAEDDEELDEILPEPGNRVIAFVRGLFGLGDNTGAAQTADRSEPRLFPEDDEYDEDDFEEDDFEEDDDPPVAAATRRRRSSRKTAASVHGEDHQLPQLTLLNPPPARRPGDSTAPEILEENAGLLQGVLDDFGVRGEIINARPGPVVTLYELEPAPGVKSSRVISLADDIARSMSAISARVAVVPGRNAIGIELPNDRREAVFLHEVLASKPYDDPKHKLPLSLGKNIGGDPVVVDLARMPHLLIAGTTGSGKSVGINAMILSLLFRLKPEHCKLIMIDPKMLELSVYDGIPHLLSPVVTDPKKAVVALKWTVREMESRYKNMSKLGVRNIDGYNARVNEAIESGEVLTRTVQTGFDRETGQAVYETEEMAHAPLPYIVVVVDEMADLMMVAGKDIESAIQRLAQMARAAGIHIIMATQRPSVDVITGTIKANFPTRISFQVTSKIDSRTILGEQGAEQLLGQGDMLFMAGGGRIGRVHGAFVSDDEVESVVQFLKRQGVPEYLDAVTADNDEDGGYDESAFASANSSGDNESNDLYDQAVAIVLRDQKASTSYIQRRLSIGYNRAATIIERMEMEGVIGPANHAGKREILAPEPDFEE